MKRIEAVHAISDNVLSSFFPDMDLKKKNLIADCVLAEMEKLGMEPPPYEIKTTGTFIDVNGLVYEDLILDEIKSVWEPE